MESVGIFLKKEREANNISLSEVAQITKITAIYLEHIEKNEFDKIPQGPYIKGYLSSYSRAIGCDVDHIFRLYESANRRTFQADAVMPASTAIKAGQDTANAVKTPNQTQAPPFRWGNRGSWFNTLVSVAKAIGASVKAAKKPIDAGGSSPTIDRKPFRHRAGRIARPGFSTILSRWPTDRRPWIYAGTALFGTAILFLAAAGFYHLFLFDPGAAVVTGAETPPPQVNTQAVDAGDHASTAVSPPSDAARAAQTPPDQATNNARSSAAASPATVVGAKPAADTASARSVPAPQVGATAAADASATRQAALLGHGADPSSTGHSGRQPTASDSPPPSPVNEASLKVMKATVCRAVENRMPAGVDRTFTPSDGKIYVWSMISSRQVPSTIRHIYYLEGKKIGEVSLDVRSTRWRTWSSKTIANQRYRGKWHVDITTSNGDLLRRLHFGID